MKTKLEEEIFDIIRDDVTADTGNYGEYGGMNRESQKLAAENIYMLIQKELKERDNILSELSFELNRANKDIEDAYDKGVADGIFKVKNNLA